MKYIDLLATHGLTVSDLSVSLTQKHKNIVKLQDAIVNSEQKLTQDISESEKENITNMVNSGHEQLEEYDAELVHKIEKWLPRREKMAKQAADMHKIRMQKSNKPKANTQTSQDVVPPPAPVSADEPPAPVIEPVLNTDTPPADNMNPPVIQTDEKKKKDSGIGWGWLIGAAAVTVGIFFGVNYMNNKH